MRGLFILILLWAVCGLAIRLTSESVTAESHANYELLLGASSPPPQPGQLYRQLRQAKSAYAFLISLTSRAYRQRWAIS
jgi:hypothetical protein